jgi:DNA-binding response OmpR family regulator
MQPGNDSLAGYVLVADDDLLTLKSVGIILRAAGFRVVTVSDGAAALEQLRRDKPRVACFDVMMGAMSGLDLCRLVKSDPALRDVHVILLTARAMERERQEGLAAGADEYVSKPFSNKDLVGRIRAAFAAAPERQPER